MVRLGLVKSGKARLDYKLCVVRFLDYVCSALQIDSTMVS